jgi:hypothetical protein
MGKIGSSEFTFGIGYSPFEHEYFTQQIDSVPPRVVLSPHAGVLISMAHTSDNNENYTNKPGFSGGVSVKWILDNTISFNSGVWFEIYLCTSVRKRVTKHNIFIIRCKS